jgi:Ca2+-binding RTX toxin-like protein
MRSPSPSAIETLESRQFLSATVALHGNTLLIRGDEHGANDILVQRRPDAGTIQVDLTSVDAASQVTTSTQSFAQSSVKRVIILGGQLDDAIIIGRNDPDWHLNVFINAGKGNDDIATGGGDDLIVAGDGNDHVDAGAGDDHILAGQGDDEISGDNGNDFLRGGKGADTLIGDAGNDMLLGQGGGHDTLIGGDGRDMFVINGHEDASTDDYDSTVDLLLGRKTKGKDSHAGKEAKHHDGKD